MAALWINLDRWGLPALLGISIFLIACFGLDNNDTWWHLGSARHLIETGSFPTSDPFSHLLDGADWIDEYWLFQLVVYAVWSLGDVQAIVLCKAAWIAAILVGTGAVLVRRGLVSWSMYSLLCLPTLVLLADRMTVRPELITWAILPAFLLLLPRGDSPPHRTALIALPLLQIIWTNSHPAFLLGPALVVIVAAGQVITCYWRANPHLLAPIIKAHTLLLGLILIACLITPYGWRLLLLPLSVTESDVYRELIIEWNSPSSGRLWLQRHAAWVLGLPLAVGLWLRRRDKDAVPWLLGLAFAFLATRVLRHNTVWALVGLILLAETWGPLCCARLNERLKLKRGLLLVSAVIMIAVCLLAATGWWWHLLGSYRRPALIPHEWRFPSDSADFLVSNSNELEGNLFNDYNLGGYLLWRLAPEQQVTIDGRLVPYGEERVREVLGVINGELPWRQWFEEHDIGAAILAQTAEALVLELWQEPDWHLVHLGQRAVVFVQERPNHSELITEFALSADMLEPYAEFHTANNPGLETDRGVQLVESGLPIFPLKTIYEAPTRARLLALLGRPDLAVKVARGQLTLTPNHKGLRQGLPELLILAGRYHLARKQWAAGEEVLLLLTKLQPRNVQAWNNLGVLYARSGNLTKADAAWSKALQLDPTNKAIRQNLMKLKSRMAN
jgi:tetratricopeptide (TPR) repeat protein